MLPFRSVRSSATRLVRRGIFLRRTPRSEQAIARDVRQSMKSRKCGTCIYTLRSTAHFLDTPSFLSTLQAIRDDRRVNNIYIPFILQSSSLFQVPIHWCIFQPILRHDRGEANHASGQPGTPGQAEQWTFRRPSHYASHNTTSGYSGRRTRKLLMR